MSMLNSLIKAGGKSLTKAVQDEAKDALSKAVVDTAKKATINNLIESTSKSLAKNAGSTLDGILGKSSGIKLPSAKVVPTTLSDYSDGAYKTIGDVIDDGMSLDDLRKGKILTKKNYDLIKERALEAKGMQDEARDALSGVSSLNKSNLPQLNREQYYHDTIGDINARSPLTGQKYSSYEDVPDYMRSHLATGVNKEFGNDGILRELFNDNDNKLSLNEMYEMYEKLAQGDNANNIYNKNNIDYGLALEGEKKANEITQDLADRMFGNKKDINVEKQYTRPQDVKVNVVPKRVEEEVAQITPELAQSTSELRDKIASFGGNGGRGGNGGIIASAQPVQPDDGFKVKLKTGDTTNIQLQNQAAGSTKQQRAMRNLDDLTIKSFNVSGRKYNDAMGRSNSIGNHYRTVAQRMKFENLDPANIAEKAQKALSLREDIKQQALQYAEQRGVKMDLSNVDNIVGLSPTQKRKLTELGLGLNDMLGDNGIVTPTQAEDIYKVLRDYAYNWEDSKDALTKMAGNACKKEADAVRKAIDDTMDSINVDYKTPLVEGMKVNGEDPKYIRKVGEQPNFKFSDLRKDQSDWITMEKLANNPLREEDTLKVAGIDTGFKNPFTAAADKIKEKVYEKQAYGDGGAENTINFTDAAQKPNDLLNNLKNAGLVGAGALGGALLGGGGQNPQTLPQQPDMTAQNEPEEGQDPYASLTIGGYNYNQLENGYMLALQAGDTAAAKIIQNMMGLLDDKVQRITKAQSQKSSKKDTASKQRNAMSVLNNLMTNYKAGGPIGGRLTQLLNTITGGGYDPKSAAYESGSKGSLGMIIKALGDSGALSEGDQQRAMSLLPQVTDTQAAANVKYQQLIQILKSAGAQ